MRHTSYTLFLFLCLTLAGCSDADAEKLRKAGDKTYDRSALIIQETWTELSRTLLDQQPATPQYDLLTKVQLRLQWERDLADLPITATITADVITLKGTVKNAEQKKLATNLATTTTGVSKVNDELTVIESEEDNGSPKALARDVSR